MSKKGDSKVKGLLKKVHKLEEKFEIMTKRLCALIKEEINNPEIDSLITGRNHVWADISIIEQKIENIKGGKSELGDSIGLYDMRISEYD